MNKLLNILIVHYNTPKLTECLIKSINKFVGTDCHVYIFDNSDVSPFTYRQENITILDNTHGEIIDFHKWLENYPNKTADAKRNGYGSAKHCYTIEKCLDLLGVDEFVLMDSDILLKKDIRDICNEENIFPAEIVKQNNKIIDKAAPFLCYINVKKCKTLGVHYFNENYMFGLHKVDINKKCDYYDTGAWFYLDAKRFQYSTFKLDDYIEHLGSASWTNGKNEDEWLARYRNLYDDEKVVVSFTTYKNRVKYAPQVIASLLNQTIKPYKVCLTLYKEDLQYVTPELQTYFNNGDVELIVSDIDIAPHKKWYYVMNKYKEYPIITVDDDVIYNSNLVETLYQAYLKHSDCVSARRVHRMKYQASGKPLPYNQWDYEYKGLSLSPSFDLCATGIGGVLYPPNILRVDEIYVDDIMECLYADDMFLKKRENDLDVKVQWVKGDKLIPGTSINVAEVQNMGLALTNNLKNRNDIYIEKIGLCKKETVKVQNKRVIYTCITGNYEALVPLTNRQSDFDYVCFTDNSGLTSDFWELRPVPQELLKLSCVKQQRIIKICPHRYLPDYDESIWIDGAVDVLSDPNKFIEKFCSDSNKSVFIRKHPSRNCIYTEGLTCIKLRKDKAEIVNPQLDKYRKENFPRNFGLAETNIIYRKHKNPYCVKLMDLWAIELLNGSHRDQLSFNYALWKTGSDGFKYLETNLVRGTYFKWYSSHNRGAITSSEKKKSVSIPVSSNLSVAKKNQGKKTVIVNNRTRRYAPIQTSKKNEKRVTVSSKRYGTSKNIAAQQISRVFGIPLHGSKSSYKPIKVETVRNTVKFKTVKQVNIVERKVIDAPKQTKVKFKPTVRNNWKKFETSNTPKQIKITSKPIVKPNIQKNKTGETPKPMLRVNPIVFKIPTDSAMSGLGGRYVPPVEIKVQKKVEKSKKTTPVVTQTNETTKSKPVNVTVSSPTKVKENKQSQVILKQDTRVLSRRVDNIFRKKIEMNNKRKMSKNGGFFR